MKLLVKSAVVTVAVLAVAVGARAFQRIADWGCVNPQSREKAEFAWSRLTYNTAMGGGGYGGFGGGYGGRYGGGRGEGLGHWLGRGF